MMQMWDYSHTLEMSSMKISMPPRKLRALLALSFTAIVSACSGGGSSASGVSSAGTASTGVSVSITPSLGKINNADVVIKKADGSVLATLNMGSLGSVTFSDLPANSPLLVEVKGTASATYYDEARNTNPAFDTSMTLRAAFITPAAGGSINVGVTPLTDVAVARLIGASLAQTTTNIDATNMAVATAVSVPDILLAPTLVASSADLGALKLTDTPAGRYALKLAALAKMALTQNSALTAPAATLMATLSQDMSDGRLDGKNGSAALNSPPYSAASFAADWKTAATAVATANSNTNFSNFLLSSNFVPIATVLVDPAAPVVTVPANITVEATGSSGSIVTFPAATAIDSNGNSLTPICTPVSGSLFAVTTTMVTCTAIDVALGKTGNAGFTVTVSDTTSPIVSAHANITVSATGPSGSIVTYSNPSATDNISGALVPTCTPMSGATFPIGPSTVTCTAHDAAGNAGSTSFTVTVNDTTPPVVTVPANIITGVGSSGIGNTVTFAASATDLISGTVATTCTPASGSTFSIGTTTVTCTAKDAANNTGSGSFTVTVADGLGVISTPAGGSYAGAQHVKLSASRAGSTLYYTTDNSTPTVNSKVYNSPIFIPANSSITLKFMGKDNLGSSTVSTASYATGGIVTDIRIQNTGSSQSNVPVTFGQVFAPGDVPAGNTLAGTLSNGSAIALQVDAKATHADGSLRHAVISAVIPSLSAGQTEIIALTPTPGATSPSTVSPSTLPAAGFTASVNITLGGVAYSAHADSLLNGSLCATCKWLSGPVVNEWLVSAPLRDSANNPHPHLTARFAIRSYTGINKARVDVTVENNWAYEPGPQDFTYDANVEVGGVTVYPSTTLKHYHHARWHKAFWWGTAPQADIKHNMAYLIATKAVPNYDQSIVISSAALTSLNSKWNTASGQTNTSTDINLKTGPMGTSGIVDPAMPSTGGRGDIGPLPSWTTMYLLSGDTQAKKITLGVGDLAGSWPIHYRDKTSDLPVNIITYPNATIAGTTYTVGNTFDRCVTATGVDCSHPFDPDSAHQPSLAYVPYLVTGDYYYLEELQFWATWNMVQQPDSNRSFGSWHGLTRWDQIRGQAWMLRTLGQVAYITPDAHSMKSYWVDRVNDNAAYLASKFVTGNANPLGIMSAENKFFFFDPILYTSPLGANTGYAPWQDDFFTWSVGYLVELGFTNAAPMLAWKAKNAVGRMIGPGVCFVDATQYFITVRPTSASAVYATQADVWMTNFGNLIDTNPASSTYNLYYKDQACGSAAQALWLTNTGGTTWAVGRMKGAANDPESYLASLQPALAVSVASGITNGQAAWDAFKNSPVKPNYAAEPQFGIIPRN